MHAAQVSARLALRRRRTGWTVPTCTEVVVLHKHVVVVVVLARRSAQGPQVFLDATGLPFLRRRRTGVPWTPAEVDVVFVADGRDHESHGVQKVELTELSELCAGLCNEKGPGGPPFVARRSVRRWGRVSVTQIESEEGGSIARRRRRADTASTWPLPRPVAFFGGRNCAQP